MTGSYKAWQALYDRRESGQVLTPDEQAELARLGEDDPASRHELEMFRQLAELDFAVPGDSRAVVEAALAAVSSRDKVVPIRPGVADPTPSESRPPPAPARPRFRRGVLAAGALTAVAAAAAAALAFWPAEQPASQAPMVVAAQPPAVELTFTSGHVLVNGRDRAVSPAALEPHTKLTVRDGRACVAIDTRTDVCLDQNSSIELDDLRPGPRTVHLLEGRAAAALGKRPSSERFSIVAGGTTATAMGTAFAVEVEQAGQRKVTVMEGTVQVTEAAVGKRSVHPGEQVTSSREALSSVRRTTRSEQARQWALLEPRQLWKQKDVGILHVAAQPDGALVSVDGLALGKVPLGVVLSSGEHRLEFELEGYEPLEKNAKLRTGEEGTLSVELTRTSAPLQNEGARSESTQTEFVASARDLLARARKLVGQGRWSEAAASYQRLRANYPRSPESHTVLVALGQLQLDRLGQPAQALRSFNAYLRSGGALSQEARYGKIRASKALGNKAAEKAAILEYLKRHPGSMEAATLKRRLSELDSR